MQQSFQASLRNLGTYYLDSLVLHSPLPSLDQTLDVWHAFEDIHASGGARRLGISNCYDLQTLRDLHARAKVKPSVVQASAVGCQLLQNRRDEASDRQQACLLNRWPPTSCTVGDPCRYRLVCVSAALRTCPCPDILCLHLCLLQNRFHRDTGYDVDIREFCRQVLLHVGPWLPACVMAHHR